MLRLAQHDNKQTKNEQRFTKKSLVNLIEAKHFIHSVRSGRYLVYCQSTRIKPISDICVLLFDYRYKIKQRLFMKQNIIHSRKISLHKSIIFAVQSARGLTWF